MGNSNSSEVIEQEVTKVLESNPEMPTDMLASLMWDSPPESLMAALQDDEFGLADFVWLDRKENKNESDSTARKSELDDEARAKRIAEIRRRIEEEVARRRMEMAQEEEAAEKRQAANKLALHCAQCKAPITKGGNLMTATASDGKVYCKAHNAQLLKARTHAQKHAAKQHPRNNNKTCRAH